MRGIAMKSAIAMLLSLLMMVSLPGCTGTNAEPAAPEKIDIDLSGASATVAFAR